MKELYTAAFFAIAMGALMIVFRQSWGVNFMRFGKSFWRNSKHGSWYPYERVYDESKGPTSFRFMGIVFIVTGIAFAIFGWVLRNS